MIIYVQIDSVYAMDLSEVRVREMQIDRMIDSVSVKIQIRICRLTRI